MSKPMSLVDRYRNDPRWDGSLELLREYVENTPLDRDETKFYNRLISEWSQE